MSKIASNNIYKYKCKSPLLPKLSLQEEETLYSGIDRWLSEKGVHISSVQESLDHFYDKKRKEISEHKGVPAIGSVCLGANLSGNKLMARRRKQLSNKNTPELKFSSYKENCDVSNLDRYCFKTSNFMSIADTELTIKSKSSDLLLLEGYRVCLLPTNLSKGQLQL